MSAKEIVSKQFRGFACMDEAQRKAIAKQGGLAAHAKGVAHEWTVEEAKIAGRKGGLVTNATRRMRETLRSLDTLRHAIRKESGQS